MKRIGICLSLCLMLFGCVLEESYERNTEMATINQTTWNVIEEKIENDETFMVMCTREDCSSCEYFIENVLGEYLKTHGFELNIVTFMNSMSAEERKPISNFVKEHPYSKDITDTIDDYEEGMLLTPTIYFIENGEVKDMLVGGNVSEKELDSMIVKYQLDQVK